MKTRPTGLIHICIILTPSLKSFNFITWPWSSTVPEQAQSPHWILNISVGEGCSWQHVPSRVLPPAFVPLALRSDSRALVTCHWHCHPAGSFWMLLLPILHSNIFIWLSIVSLPNFRWRCFTFDSDSERGFVIEIWSNAISQGTFFLKPSQT